MTLKRCLAANHAVERTRKKRRAAHCERYRDNDSDAARVVRSHGLRRWCERSPVVAG